MPKCPVIPATWKQQRERLEQLLTPEELESARASTLNAHYTAPVVIRAIYAALQRLGFTHERILEPALGLGHFIGLMPEEMQGRSLITGIEINSISTYFEGEMAEAPKAKHGYSRDKRSDCRQVVIAVVLSLEGFPWSTK